MSDISTTTSTVSTAESLSPRSKSHKKSHSRKASHSPSPSKHLQKDGESLSPRNKSHKKTHSRKSSRSPSPSVQQQDQPVIGNQLNQNNLQKHTSVAADHPNLIPQSTTAQAPKRSSYVYEHPNLLPTSNTIHPENYSLLTKQEPTVSKNTNEAHPIHNQQDTKLDGASKPLGHDLGTKQTPNIHQDIYSTGSPNKLKQDKDIDTFPNLEQSDPHSKAPTKLQQVEKETIPTEQIVTEQLMPILKVPNQYGLMIPVLPASQLPPVKKEEPSDTHKSIIQPKTHYTPQPYPKELEAQFKKQEEQILQKKLSGEQDKYKMQNARNVLNMLQIVLEGDVPGTEVINDVLLKAEQFLMAEAQTAQADPETKQALEDIGILIGSAKQMARNKDLGDRLQRIAEETAKALTAVNDPNLTNSTRESTYEVLNFVENWRPLFDLLVSSREFRVMIVDTIHIFRRILLRHRLDTLPQTAENKFLDGKSASEITQEVTKDATQSFKSPQGELNVLISDEEFDAIYEDMTYVIIKLSKTPAYRVGLDRIFNLLHMLNRQLNTTNSAVAESKVLINAKRAQLETEDLLASFAGRERLDNFIDSLKALVQKMNRDEKTTGFLTELKSFVLDTRIADSLDEYETKERLKKFSREAREIVYQYAYANELSNFLEKSDQLVEGIKNDQFVSILRHHAGVVANDLSYVDRQGNVQLDTELLGKIRSVIGPTIAESLKYIPIPRIEENNMYRHFWVDNIVLCGYDIIPENIHIQVENSTKLNTRDLTDQYHTRLVLSFDNIRTELKNLDFFYNKKTFPQLTEHGKVSFRLPGQGASIVITYDIAQQSGSTIPKFHSGTANIQIHNFEVEFHKETLSHDILVPMLSTVLKYQIQREIELSIEKNIGNLVNSLGDKLTSALVGMNRPLMQGIETMKKTVKGSEMGTIVDNRRQTLE